MRALYDRLYALDPSPIVLLNRAVATRFAAGPAAALAEVDALRDRLAGPAVAAQAAHGSIIAEHHQAHLDRGHIANLMTVLPSGLSLG